MLIDCHNHTHNSPDGENESVLERCARAAELGIGVLAVTDHCEVNRFFSLAHYGVEPNGYDTYDFGRDFELSMQENTAAKAHTPAGVKLLCGIELGQATHELALAEHVYADVRLDFVIGSVHMTRDETGWFDLFYIDGDRDDAYYHAVIDAYLEEELRLAQWGRFSVLGHLTLPVRCINEMRHKNLSFRPHMAQVEEILRTAITKGVGIECNTNRGNTPLPDAEILKLYRSLGGEIITLGSDAHTAQHLGCAVQARQELLRSCGFRYFTTFDRMKPSFQAL